MINRKEELRKAAYTGDIGACEALAVYLIEGVKSKIKKVNNGVTRVKTGKDGDCCEVYASLMVKSDAVNDFIEAFNNLHFIQEMGGKLKRFNFSHDNKRDYQKIVELIQIEGVN